MLLVGVGVMDGVVVGCGDVEWGGVCPAGVDSGSAGVVVGAGSFGVVSCSVLLVFFS